MDKDKNATLLPISTKSGLSILIAGLVVSGFSGLWPLSTVSMAILGTGLVLAIFGTAAWALSFSESLINKSIEERLIRRMKLASEFGSLGLSEMHSDSSTFDVTSIVVDSRRLVVALNDGRTWASVHRDRLRKRLLDPMKETVVILVHPESPMIEVLSRKGSKNPEDIRKRIEETVHLLEEIKQPTSNLEILGHFLFNPHAIILGDETAVVTPYFASRGGRTVPAFEYHDSGPGCYFRELAGDLERLRMDTKNLVSQTKTTSLPEVVKLRPRIGEN